MATRILIIGVSSWVLLFGLACVALVFNWWGSTPRLTLVQIISGVVIICGWTSLSMNVAVLVPRPFRVAVMLAVTTLGCFLAGYVAELMSTPQWDLMPAVR